MEKGKNEKYFRITMESVDNDESLNFQSDIKTIWESKFDDEIDDILDGCISCLRGVGFTETTILKSMERSVNFHKEASVLKNNGEK